MWEEKEIGIFASIWDFTPLREYSYYNKYALIYSMCIGAFFVVFFFFWISHYLDMRCNIVWVSETGATCNIAKGREENIVGCEMGAEFSCF